MKHLLSISLLALLCAACANSDIKSYLQKPAPDEFSVITNQPLVVPPNFDLRSPSGADVVAESSSVSSTKAGKLDKNDKDFLEMLGGKPTKSKIKKDLDGEYIDIQNQRKQKGFIRKTIANLGNKEDTIIDPEKESERIKANVEEDKPINEGEVPTKDSKSTLEKIFNY